MWECNLVDKTLQKQELAIREAAPQKSAKVVSMSLEPKVKQHQNKITMGSSSAPSSFH